MTNQEEIQSAIEWIEGLRDRWNDKDNIKYCNMAIKALEQTSALDKVRAEILQMPTISLNANDIYKADVLAIINKYKAESKLDGNPVDIDKAVEH
jgi:hypothetical protein